MPADKPPEKSAANHPGVTVAGRTRVLLWICLAAWVVSFFLPAAKLDPNRRAEPGFAIAYEALVLLIVPVKGAWLGLLPSVWTVFINLFMLLLPIEIRAIEEGEGRVFAQLFTIATAVPIGLAYLPPSLGFIGLPCPLLIGFYVWEFSMIAAALLLARTLWSGERSWMPAAVSSVLLLCLPISRAVWNPATPPAKRTAIPQTFRPPIETPETVQPTTIVVESSPNPSLSGEDVTVSARVSVPWGKASTGTVTFTDLVSKTLIGRIHTTNGTATCSTSELSTGEHAIRASFEPDARGLLGSEQDFVQTVDDPGGKKVSRR